MLSESSLEEEIKYFGRNLSKDNLCLPIYGGLVSEGLPFFFLEGCSGVR